MNITYNLNVWLINKIINNNNNLNSYAFLVKIYIEIISLSNKIIIRYLSTYVHQISLNAIKNYTDFFYSFISDDNAFISISNFMNNNEKDKKYTNQTKFILDIIEFFHKLIELIYINFPEYKFVSKNNNNDNYKEIINYIKKDFLTKEKIKSILFFIIKKSLIFNDYEIYIAQENCENFYLCFTELSSLYDLKSKAGNVCNLIYTVFRKKHLDIFQEFENNLISLTTKENELLKINKTLSGEELNIKCALLFFFYYLDDYFNLNNEKQLVNISKIFMEQININIIKKKDKEVFSTFIIIRILTKIISNNFGKNDLKKKIMEKICNIFFSSEIKETLIELTCFDLFNEYIDMQPMIFNNKINNNNDDIFPTFFIQNYIIKVSQLINKISSPEIHSNIIETTNNIINVINKDKLLLDFNIIIPFLEIIWNHKYMNNNNINLNGVNDNYSLIHKKNIEIKNKNKIYIVRRDLIKLMIIIIKKLGFYSYNKDNKNIKNNFELFHNFIFQIMQYSFNCNKTEETDYLYCEIYNLLILIQDNYYESISLLSYNDIKNICSIIENDTNFLYFSKFFEFFNTILEKSSNCNNNQYILCQFLIIEQFISFCFISKINMFFENENFIDKIIYILNNIINNSLKDYYQFIYNIIEYILYIISTFSNFSINNKNKYTNFVYQLIIKIIKEVELNNNNFDIYFGSIQLANRLIYVNACKNIISNEFNIQMAETVISFYNYYQNKKGEIKLNFLQKNIFQNCLSNLNKLLNINNNNINNTVNDINNIIKQIYNDVKKNNKHASNYDIISSRWLFFFNKISNDIHFYKLTSEEDQLRLYWTEIFEKKQIFFSVNKDFNIKYFFLKIDPMINEE